MPLHAKIEIFICSAIHIPLSPCDLLNSRWQPVNPYMELNARALISFRVQMAFLYFHKLQMYVYFDSWEKDYPTLCVKMFYVGDGIYQRD